MNETRQIRAWCAALSLTCIALLFAGATNAGAEPEKEDSLAGTTWSGPDSDGDDFVYTFEPNGKLSYKSL